MMSKGSGSSLRTRLEHLEKPADAADARSLYELSDAELFERIGLGPNPSDKALAAMLLAFREGCSDDEARRRGLDVDAAVKRGASDGCR